MKATTLLVHYDIFARLNGDLFAAVVAARVHEGFRRRLGRSRAWRERSTAACARSRSPRDAARRFRAASTAEDGTALGRMKGSTRISMPGHG